MRSRTAPPSALSAAVVAATTAYGEATQGGEGIVGAALVAWDTLDCITQHCKGEGHGECAWNRNAHTLDMELQSGACRSTIPGRTKHVGPQLADQSVHGDAARACSTAEVGEEVTLRARTYAGADIDSGRDTGWSPSRVRILVNIRIRKRERGGQRTTESHTVATQRQVHSDGELPGAANGPRTGGCPTPILGREAGG